MNNEVICTAQIKARLTKLYLGITAASLIFTIVWQTKIGSNRDNNLFGYLVYPFYKYSYTTGSKELKLFWGNNCPACVSVIIFILLLIWGGLILFVSKKCSLSLTKTGVVGNRRKMFSNNSIQFPIEKIDSIMLSNTLVNKFFGGKTVTIRTASGFVKFPWIQNADEFVNATLAKIEEYKNQMLEDNKSIINSVAQTTSLDTNISSSSVAKIKELKEMLDQGLISQEEFDAKRKEFLDKM